MNMHRLLSLMLTTCFILLILSPAFAEDEAYYFTGLAKRACIFEVGSDQMLQMDIGGNDGSMWNTYTTMEGKSEYTNGAFYVPLSAVFTILSLRPNDSSKFEANEYKLTQPINYTANGKEYPYYRVEMLDDQKRIWFGTSPEVDYVNGVDIAANKLRHRPYFSEANNCAMIPVTLLTDHCGAGASVSTDNITAAVWEGRMTIFNYSNTWSEIPDNVHSDAEYKMIQIDGDTRFDGSIMKSYLTTIDFLNNTVSANTEAMANYFDPKLVHQYPDIISENYPANISSAAITGCVHVPGSVSDYALSYTLTYKDGNVPSNHVIVFSIANDKPPLIAALCPDTKEMLTTSSQFYLSDPDMQKSIALLNKIKKYNEVMKLAGVESAQGY